MMLILAVIVTVLSLWNGIYLPGLKQQAEVEHLQQVEEGMVRIDSAIGDAMYYRHNGSLSVPIPLGGGDIMLNNLRSGGVLRIEQDENPTLIISVNGNPDPYNLHLSNITYAPVSNFWINQGYSWQYGYVNVTKGNLTTISVLDPDPNNFAGLLFDFQKFGDVGYNLSYVNIIPSNRNMTSGNGIAQVTLNVDSESLQSYTLSPGGTVTVKLDENLPYDFKTPLNSTIVSRFNGEWNCDVVSGSTLTFKYHGLDPTSITVERLEIVLSAE